MSRYRSVVLVLGIAGFAVPTVLAREGQTIPGVPGTAQRPADSIQPAAPQAIPQSEVLRRVDEAIAALAAIRFRLNPDPAVADVESELPVSIQAVQRLGTDLDLETLDRLSLRNLQDMRQRWARYEAQFRDWQRSLDERLATLEVERRAVRTVRDVWDVANRAAVAENYPVILIERTRDVQGTVDQVETYRRGRQDVVLGLQDQVSQQLSAITHVLTQIDIAEGDARQRLFEPDSPPLWQAVFSRGDDLSLTSEVRDSWTENWATFIDYMRSSQTRLLFHFVLFAALMALLVDLRRRNTQWTMERTLEAPAHIQSHPVSAALLVALLFTRWIHPDAPIVVADLAQLAILLPVLRLLPGLVHQSMRKPLYGLAGLYALNQIGSLALEQSILQRLLLLGVTGLALVGLLALVRQGPSLAGRTGRWWGIALFAGRIGIVALASSVVANVIGNVSLAELLTSATLNSALLAMVMVAGAMVLEGVLKVLLRTRIAQSVNAVRLHTQLLARRGTSGLQLGALLLWLVTTLSLFRVLSLFVGTAGAILGRVWSVGSFNISAGDVLAFVITLWIAILASRFIRFVLNEDVLPRIELPRGVPGAISTVAHYVILGIGFVFAIGAAGINLGQFALLAGAFGVGIGFGLQNVVNNFVSGLVLIFERPIQVGDTIEIGELLGRVRRIGIRSSTVRTFDGAEVIVPNGNLISADVVNWTLSDRLRRIELPVGVAYGTDPNQVLELLRTVTPKQDGVLENPPLQALFGGFGDSSLDFSVRFWTAEFENFRVVASNVNVAIYDALKEAGITIPFPQRDLHLRSVDPSVKRALSEGRGGTAETAADFAP